MGPCGLQVVGGLVSRPRSEPDAFQGVRDTLKERSKTQVRGESSQLGGEERGRGNRKQVDKGPVRERTRMAPELWRSESDRL